MAWGARPPRPPLSSLRNAAAGETGERGPRPPLPRRRRKRSASAGPSFPQRRLRSRGRVHAVPSPSPHRGHLLAEFWRRGGKGREDGRGDPRVTDATCEYLGRTGLEVGARERPGDNTTTGGRTGQGSTKQLEDKLTAGEGPRSSSLKFEAQGGTNKSKSTTSHKPSSEASNRGYEGL